MEVYLIFLGEGITLELLKRAPDLAATLALAVTELPENLAGTLSQHSKMTGIAAIFDREITNKTTIAADSLLAERSQRSIG